MFTDTDQAVLVIIVCLQTIAILFLCKQYYTLVNKSFCARLRCIGTINIWLQSMIWSVVEEVSDRPRYSDLYIPEANLACSVFSFSKQ